MVRKYIHYKRTICFPITIFVLSNNLHLNTVYSMLAPTETEKNYTFKSWLSLFITKTNSDLLDVPAEMQDVTAQSFAGWPASGSNECKNKKENTKSNRRRNVEEFDLRRGVARTATASSIIVAKMSRGRGLNCVPFLSNFFNLSRLGQLITGRNDFCFTAGHGGFSVHDDESDGGDDNGVAARRNNRFFEYAIAYRIGVTYCVAQSRASGTFDAKLMLEKEGKIEKEKSAKRQFD